MGAPAKAAGVLSTLRNSTARGAYNLANAMPIFGNVAKAERIRSQLLELENTEKQLAQGVSAEELFGSEDDPTGEAHRIVSPLSMVFRLFGLSFRRNSPKHFKTLHGTIRRADCIRTTRLLKSFRRQRQQVKRLNLFFQTHPLLQISALSLWFNTHPCCLSWRPPPLPDPRLRLLWELFQVPIHMGWTRLPAC